MIGMGIVCGIALVADRLLFEGVTFSTSPWGMAGKLALNTVFILIYMIFVWRSVHVRNRAFLAGA